MVIEHEFVTTLPSSDVLRRVGEYLLAEGFRLSGDAGFSMGGEPRVRYQRRLKKPGSAKRLVQFPQEVLIEFDRGRVTLAVHVESYHNGARADTHRRLEPHRSYAEAIARLIEAIATGRDPAPQRNALEMINDGYYQRNVACIVLYVLFGVLVVVALLIAIFAR